VLGPAWLLEAWIRIGSGLAHIPDVDEAQKQAAVIVIRNRKTGGSDLSGPLYSGPDKYASSLFAHFQTCFL
jgi:hypothetical protein